jgi:hypothetical protein
MLGRSSWHWSGVGRYSGAGRGEQGPCFACSCMCCWLDWLTALCQQDGSCYFNFSSSRTNVNLVHAL